MRFSGLLEDPDKIQSELKEVWKKNTKFGLPLETENLLIFCKIMFGSCISTSF